MWYYKRLMILHTNSGVHFNLLLEVRIQPPFINLIFNPEAIHLKTANKSMTIIFPRYFLNVFNFQTNVCFSRLTLFV